MSGYDVSSCVYDGFFSMGFETSIDDSGPKPQKMTPLRYVMGMRDFIGGIKTLHFLPVAKLLENKRNIKIGSGNHKLIDESIGFRE